MIIVLSLALSGTIVLALQRIVMNEYETQFVISYDANDRIAAITGALEQAEKVLSGEDIKRPVIGDAYAVISANRVDFKKDVYMGDGDAQLDAGIGQFRYSGLPGEGKPILLAGHNGTEFYKLREMEVEDIVEIKTAYGTYAYRITNMEIENADDFDANKLNDPYEYLIMYTCYPFNVVDTPQRYFVYAEFVSGPKIEGEIS